MTPELDPEIEVLVAEATVIAERVRALKLRRPDGAALPAWEPGAHIDLVLGEELVRQYSLCGDPDDLSSYTVAVLRELDGRGGSAYVHDQLLAGDPVRIRGPRNHFQLLAAERYLFIAGGIGITPLIAMIAAVEREQKPWQLVYGGRTRGAMAYAGELQQRYGERVQIIPLDEAGLPDLPALLSEPAATAAAHAVYCCGPEGLLGAVEQLCAGWPAGALQLERFAPKQELLQGATRPFTVKIASTGETHEIPAGRSVLEVLEEAGLPVISSCQEGTCGTCETGVLAGRVDHRDSVLTDAEKQADDVMMICVSRALDAELVLEL